MRTLIEVQILFFLLRPQTPSLVVKLSVYNFGKKVLNKNVLNLKVLNVKGVKCKVIEKLLISSRASCLLII